MINEELFEGTKVKEIWWPDTANEEMRHLKHDSEGVKSLFIVNVAGQMAWVPWIKAEMTDGTFQMININMTETIKLEEK